MKREHDDFFKVLTEISQKLEAGRSLVSESGIDDFQSEADSVFKNFEAIMDENRTMRLGIVGEVKAGKSSFLNALLFEGKDILPKAPTPMTAALTRLGYSEHPYAEIHFYNEVDWKAIENRAREYDQIIEREYDKYVKKERERQQQVEKGTFFSAPAKQLRLLSKEEFISKRRSILNISEETRSCKEIYDMAKGLNVAAYLSDEPRRVEPDNTSSFIGELSQYVGANGKYTPLVKYTEIHLDNDLLKDIEVIDTPGLNDPILSRSRMTTKFLMDCDAIFLLSYVGQFLTEEDISFLTSILPREGINYASIIGSKFDSGLLDNNKFKEFRKTYINCRDTYLNQAKTNIASFKKSGIKAPIVEVLEKSKPQFVSSLMYSAMRHKLGGEPYSEEEAHIINRLKERFDDFRDDPDTLAGFANIDDVREKMFKDVKAQKDEILSDRRENLINSQYIKFISILDDIQTQTAANLKELKETDVEKLQNKIDATNHSLNACRSKVKAIFEQSAVHVQSSMNQILIEVMKEAGNFKDINVESTTVQKDSSYTTGHLWWKKTHYRTKYITTHIANVSDLQNNIESYLISAMNLVNKRFEHMLNINDIKAEVKKAVTTVFDLSDKNFDEQTIIVPLESTLNKIKIPELSFEVEKYYTLIDEKLSGIVSNGTVLNNNIPIMKTAQNEILAFMKKDMEENVKRQCQNVSNILSAQSGLFIDTVSGEIEENISKIKAMLEEGKAGIEKFKNFLDILKEAKSIINKRGK